jgi:hypothetical protein
MKLKLIASFLALTMMSWAQSTTSTQTPAPEQKSTPADAKASCPCCEKMASADSKEGHACMHHSANGKDEKATMSCCSGKDAAACCAGKDGKSCAKNDKSSASCCQDSKDGQGHEMSCCSNKDGKHMTHDCCGGNQCGKSAHHDHGAPGN